MKIGQLRKRIELRHISRDQDSYGEPITTWPSAFATVWGSVRPIQGSELENAQQISAEVTHKIRIRHNAALIPTDRIVYATREFDVVHILNFQERGIFDDILCKEII